MTAPTPITPAQPSQEPTTAASTTLVTGPVRSGKSRHAEALLSGYRQVLYVATGRPATGDDPEWAARVRSHQARRPDTWRTLETSDLDAALREAEGPVLVECLGTWLTALVDETGWHDLASATRLVRARTDQLLRTLCATAQPVVVVTNEVGWSLVPVTASGRFFQDELSRLNAAVSAVAGVVHLVVAGRVVDLTAAPPVQPSPLHPAPLPPGSGSSHA